MRVIQYSAAAAALALAGCEPKRDTPPPPDPQASAQALSGQAQAVSAAAVPPTVKSSWVEADGPGETALEWRAVEDQPGFMLSCAQEGPAFRVSLPDPASPPTANGSRATLYLGEAAFPLTVLAGEVIGPHIDGELAVTPSLLAKLAAARQVRLAVGAAVTETGADTEGKLAGLASSCSLLTGIEYATP